MTSQSSEVPGTSHMTKTIPAVASITNKPAAVSISTGIRKIPIAIHHKEKVKNFVIPDTKTVMDLYNEILRLSNCRAPFEISSFSSNINTSDSSQGTSNKNLKFTAMQGYYEMHRSRMQ